MARIIQVLLPLVCMVLAEAQLHIPFFYHIQRPTHKNLDYNSGYDTWFQNFGKFNSDSHERDKSHEDYDLFYHADQGNGWNLPGINNVFNIPNPGYDAHRHQPPHMGNNPQEKREQDHNDIPNVQKPEEKPKEIPPIDKTTKEQNKVSTLNEDNISDVKNKLNEAIISDVKNNSVSLPPKTNEIKNDNKTNEIKNDIKTNEIKKEDDKKDKDSKKVDLNKKKDFLLVGQDNNGNNVYLLHENNPNPNIVVTPNGDQPGNNIIYVPYNPGQNNHPIYQVINGQPGSLPTNIQMTSNPGQSNTNLNTGNQNPGYVTIYSNGELIQIPGVVVNSAPNNVPLHNGNQVQGTNYIIANTVPNIVQTIPAIQNPDTNVIYATIPNQASNGPINVQLPNCVNTMSNGCETSTVQGVNNGVSSNGLPSNVVFYQANPNTVAQPAVLTNDVSYSYVQPNMVANQGQGPITIAIPNQGTLFSNQNGPYQQAFEIPVNSGSNGYNQPIVSNLGQGQNAPIQRGLMKYQNMPIQAAVQLPVGNNNNGNNQLVVTNQGEGPNIPYQGAIQMPSTTNINGYYQPTASSQIPEVNAPNQGVIYYQYMPTQPAVQVPINNGINGYSPPMVSNQVQGPEAPNQGVIVNNQNTPLQPAVEIPIPNGYNVYRPVTNPSPPVNVESLGEMSSKQNVQPPPTVIVNSGSNEYQRPQVPNQGDQGTNAFVNIPNNDEVITQEFDNAQPLATSTLFIDSTNLSSLGALPAIMISDFKDKSSDKKDKKKNKHKNKKPKEDEKPKVLEPFTNKMEDVKR